MITYKILVNSIPFANMRGTSPAEVAKKAASKILGNSLNYVRFSIQAKTGKIRHYDAKRENLVRPYHKNGKLVKYRIVVKKLGKQVGGKFPPDLDDDSDPIFQFFPKGEYKIEIISEYKKYHITSNSVWCIDFHFEIDKRKIELDNLNKCYNKSGSDNLKKIIEYGKYLKSRNIIDKIELFDASTIYDKRISYALLSILSTGMSWYNSFGFISPNFKVEKEYNSKFLGLKFDEFLNLCIDILFEQKKEYFDNLNSEIIKIQEYKEQKGSLSNRLQNSLAKKLNNKTKKNTLTKEGLLEYIMEELNAKKKIFIDNFGNLTVKEVFTSIKEKLKSQLSEQELNIIIELFLFIESSRIIQYHLGLTLMLGATYSPKLTNLDDPIFMFFPIEKYDIQLQKFKQEIIIQSVSNTEMSEWCSTFFIKEKTLYIDHLNKCNEKSGKENLDNIINYGKYLKSHNIIDKIELEDESRIQIRKYSFSLSLLSILSSGISWYNSFGFISENFEDEKRYNARFLGMNLEDFLNECIPKILENRLKYYFEKLNNQIEKYQNLPNSQYKKNKLEQLLKEKSERNGLSIDDFTEKIRLELVSKKDDFILKFKNENENVKQLFIIIKNRLKNHEELSPKKLDEFIELLNFIESSEIIMYYKKNLRLTL